MKAVDLVKTKGIAFKVRWSQLSMKEDEKVGLDKALRKKLKAYLMKELRILRLS